MSDDQFLPSTRHIFRAMKKQGDATLTQLSLEEMQRVPVADLNSIAVIVQHMHGNMLSRWTDFLSSDGEKETRDRDGEFEARGFSSRDEILKLWDDGWACVFSAIDPLSTDDLRRTITIRGQPHSVVEAVQRQIQHYSYHIGQMVLLARMIKGAEWKTLSIARGASKTYSPSGLGGEPGRAP
jgi:Protein of unknown function (DUF1572)